MRPTTLLSAAALLSVTGTLLAAPAASAAVTCGGERATIVGTPGADRLRGTPRRDVIAARGGADTIRGRGGDDLVCGGPGRDLLQGQAGSDTLLGNRGADEFRGGAGVDLLVGGHGGDFVLSGAGADSVRGGPGHDLALATRADDVRLGPRSDIVIGFGNDITARGGSDSDIYLGLHGRGGFAGGAGRDFVTLLALTPDEAGPVQIDLGTGTATAEFASIAFSRVEGGFGDVRADTLLGDDGRNFLFGEGGRDTVAGLGGNDVLAGGGGLDSVLGGPGNDQCADERDTLVSCERMLADTLVTAHEAVAELRRMGALALRRR